MDDWRSTNLDDHNYVFLRKPVPQQEQQVAGLCLHLVPICIQSSVLSPRHAWSPPFT